MADITAILTATQSADAGARQAAEEQLKNAQESNLAGFLTGLASELANEQKPPEVRRLAGLILKNALDARDDGSRGKTMGRDIYFIEYSSFRL